LGHHFDGESRKLCKLSFGLIVYPIMNVGIEFNSRAFNLQNVIANANDRVLDEAPVSHKLGANVNINAKSIGKVWILGQDKVTLPMELKVFANPCFEVRIPIASSVGIFIFVSKFAPVWSS